MERGTLQKYIYMEEHVTLSTCGLEDKIMKVWNGFYWLTIGSNS
jgi:hypothetical protein